MSKPITNTPATPITFEQRLQLVQAEVSARVMSQPKELRNYHRAYYWRKWINKNVLEVA